MLTWLSRHATVLTEAVRLDRERARTARKVDETRFLPAALEILETPPSPAARALLLLLLLFLGLTVAWSIFGRVDVVASAQGRITPQGRVKVIQAADQGVVRAIHVEEGDTVRAGQPLLDLDPAFTEADMGQLRQGLLAAQLEQARARALLGGGFAAPAGVAPIVAAAEAARVRARVSEFEAARAALEGRMAERRSELVMIQAEIAKVEGQLPLAERQLSARQDLADKGLSPRLMVMELEERVIGLRQDLRVRRAEAAKRETAIEGAGREMARLRAEYEREAYDQLSEAQDAVDQRTEELVKAGVRSGLQRVTAPVDGVVQQLSVAAPGAVVRPADPLMVVVPRGETLVVDAMVLNRDAGFVRAGQPVEVKLEAYPFTQYGVVQGRIERISTDAVEDEQQGLVYPARVRLLSAHLTVDGVRRALAPGLSATAEIKTGRRRIIESCSARSPGVCKRRGGSVSDVPERRAVTESNDPSSYWPQPVQDFLRDPRLDGLKPNERRRLEPLGEPDSGVRYVELFEDGLVPRPGYEWVNPPVGEDHYRYGYGKGFGVLKEPPVFVSPRPRPKRRFSDVWGGNDFLVCSRRFLDVFEKIDPGAIETREIDWRFEGGERLAQPYYLLSTSSEEWTPSTGHAPASGWII